MSRFERWIYVVLVAVVLVWPGVRRQFFLQIRQITHTTDVRVGDWPKFTTSYDPRLPVPITKLRIVAEKHGLWGGLAELEYLDRGNHQTAQGPASAIKAYDKVLAANPRSEVAYARSFILRPNYPDFYRPEQREIDEKIYGRRNIDIPSRISPEVAQPYLEIARAGAKLDPQNPLYDYGLAMIYVGMWKDDEAIAAVDRGWRKPEYNTYQKEASRNARQLLMEAGVPSLEATVNSVSSFSQLARMRRLAQSLKVIAQKAEENGDWRRGWELRLAAFRMGNQLITSGQEYVTPLVGVAIQTIATGSLPRTPEQAEQMRHSGNDRDAQAKVIVQILRDYVTKHQLGSEGNLVISQYMAGQEFRRLYREMIEGNTSLYLRWQYSMLMWYGATSILVELLITLVILGILSLPRTIRMAQGDRFPKIVGLVGTGLTLAGLFGITYYAFRDWANNPTPIPAGLTWGLMALLPALIIIFALARRRPSLASIRASARYALPVIAIAYVVLSGVLAIERGSFEKRALQSIEHGLDPQQIEILKKTGFRR